MVKPEFVPTIAQALQELGLPKAIVVYGREKLDEAGLGDNTDLAILDRNQVSLSEINPEELG